MSWKSYRPNISSDNELLEMVCKIIRMKSMANAPSVMILGPPGIGKSDRLLEAVKTCLKSISNRNDILIYEDIVKLFYHNEPSEIVNKAKDGVVIVRISAPYVLPQDFGWYPEKSDIKAYVDLPPLWFLILNEAKYGALIIEDITEVDDRYTMLLLQRLAFEKLLKMYKVNKPIFMTGNPSEFSANDDLRISITVASGRFLIQTLSIPTLKSWKAYMDREYESWDTDIYKFLDLTSDFGAKGAVDECIEKYGQKYAYISDSIRKLHLVQKFMLLYDETFIMRPEYMQQVKRTSIEVNNSAIVHTPRTWSAFASMNISGDPKSYFNRIINTLNKYLAAVLTGFKAIRSGSEKFRELALAGLRLLSTLIDALSTNRISDLEKDVLKYVSVEGPFRTVNAMYEYLFNDVMKPSDTINHKIFSMIESMVNVLDKSFDKEDEMIKMGIAWGITLGTLSLILDGGFEGLVGSQLLSTLNVREKQILNLLKDYTNIVKECSRNGDA